MIVFSGIWGFRCFYPPFFLAVTALWGSVVLPLGLCPLVGHFPGGVGVIPCPWWVGFVLLSTGPAVLQFFDLVLFSVGLLVLL